MTAATYLFRPPAAVAAAAAVKHVAECAQIDVSPMQWLIYLVWELSSFPHSSFFPPQ